MKRPRNRFRRGDKAVCPICGKIFKMSNRGPRKYCSPKCAHKGELKLLRQKRKEALKAAPPVECATCGKKFRPKRKGQKFCSPKCRWKASYERNKEYFKAYYLERRAKGSQNVLPDNVQNAIQKSDMAAALSGANELF